MGCSTVPNTWDPTSPTCTRYLNMRSICKLLSHGSSEWAWERKTNGHVVLNRLSGIVVGQSGIAVNLLNSLNADVVNVPWSTCGQKRQGDWGKRWSHDDQEEIKDDGRVKDRRRKQKLFGHRDRKWGEGEKRRRVKSGGGREGGDNLHYSNSLKY